MSGNMRAQIRKRTQEREKNKGNKFSLLNTKISELKIKKEGRKKLIILPFKLTKPTVIDEGEKGDDWYRVALRVHSNIGPDKLRVVCPTTFGSKKCPICEHRKALLDDGGHWEDKEISKLKFSQRDVFFVLDLDDEDDPLKWVELSNFNFGSLLEEELNDEENTDPIYDYFASLTKGATLVVRFAEESFANNKYYKAERIDFKERTKSEQALVKQYGHDLESLDELVVLRSYDEIYNIFHDLDDGSDDEDEDEAPKNNKTTAKATKDEDYDDDDDDDVAETEDDADEEEEEEAPKKSSRSSRRSKKSEPEPEEEEEEEEEEKKPARSSRRDKKTQANKCPYGHKFGIDEGEHDDCEDCPTAVWEECEAKTKESK